VFQTVRSARVYRGDHVWVQGEAAGGAARFKCVLCGAVCVGWPPPYPTRPDWQAERYEPLTDAERALAPFRGG
jgi:hypothetical protein